MILIPFEAKSLVKFGLKFGLLEPVWKKMNLKSKHLIRFCSDWRQRYFIKKNLSKRHVVDYDRFIGQIDDVPLKLK